MRGGDAEIIIFPRASRPNNRNQHVLRYANLFAAKILWFVNPGIDINVDRGVAELARGKYWNLNDAIFSARFCNRPGSKRHLSRVKIKVTGHPPECLLWGERQVNQIDPFRLDPTFTQCVSAVVLLAGERNLDFIHRANQFRKEGRTPLGVSRQTLYDLLEEKQPVTPMMVLRLGKLCGNGPDLWLNLQKRYDLQRASEQLGAKINAIPTLEVALERWA